MAERTESQGVFEMLWDCDHCGTKGLLAKSQRYCAECGAPQNPDKRYFPKEGEARKVEGQKYEGADRTCPACNAPQSAASHNCTNCGSPLDGAAEVRGVMSPEAGARKAASPVKKSRKWIWLVVLGVVLLAAFGIWFRFIRKVSATMTVTAHRWERVIPIEEYNEFSETSWRDKMPRDARMARCNLKQRSTKRVEDGEECRDERKDKKDGTFEVVKKCTPKYREEPVNDEWCTYRVQRWKELTSAPLRTAGTGMTPVSPQGAPPDNAPPTLGAKRSRPMRQKLILEFGKDTCDDVPEAKWRKYTDGTKVKVQVRASSGAVVCDSF
jgi:hypothetical protein